MILARNFDTWFRKVYILNKSENATPELFAIYIQIMQIKNVNENVS